MSKNTGTSELINYFDLGVNGDVGIAGSLDINTIANATTDTDTFLVSDTGIIKYRTGAQLLSDIGAAPAVAGGYVPYTGATTNVDLGVYNLTASAIIANGSGSNSGIVHLESNAIHSLVNGYGSIASGTTNQFNLYQTTGAGVFRGAILSLNSITEFATRTYTLPDADGTLALTSSLGAYLPLAGGTMTGSFQGVTGSNFVGTSVNSRILVTASGVANTVIGFNNSGSTTDGVTNNTAYVGVLQDFPLVFTTNSVERFRLAASTGAATFSSSAAGYGITLNHTSENLRLKMGAVAGGIINIQGEVISSGGVYPIVLNRDGGNVGIGTNPNARLHIKAPSNDQVLRFEQQNDTTSQYYFNIDSAVNGALSLVSNYLGGNVVGFCQNRSGNVLIGTTTDIGGKLQVSAPALISVFQSTTSTQFTGLEMRNGGGSFYFGQDNSSGNFYGSGAAYAGSLYLSGAYPMAFFTSGTERMRITSGGNVGIGTASPNSLAATTNLVVRGVSGSSIALVQSLSADAGCSVSLYSGASSSDDPAILFQKNLRFGSVTDVGLGGFTERMRITSGGYLKASNTGSYYSIASPYHELRNNSNDNEIVNITHAGSSPYGISLYYTTASPNNSSNWFLYCSDSTAQRMSIKSNGGIYNFQANNVNLSDERTKKDIEPLESYWDKFKAIEIVKFKYKDQTHDDFNIGVIAQQVETIAPEFVDTDGWDTKSKIVNEEEPLKAIYTSDLHHATIKVLQEAMIKIEELQVQIDKLKNV